MLGLNFRQFDMLQDYLKFVSDVDLQMSYSGQKMAFEVFRNDISFVFKFDNIS